MKTIDVYKQPSAAYQLRTKKIDDKNYLIAPVVMMVEGVHAGSGGAVYHSISELGKYPAAWDGIPVIIQHPKNPEGQFISANDVSVIESCIGRVYETKVDGSKLVANIYLDEIKLKKLAPQVLTYVRNGKPMEVSLGIFTDTQQTQGEWNGEAYENIAMNHRPDHLALLPGGQGACSWNDGCGIRVNEADVTPELISGWASIGLRLEPMVNAASFNDILRAIETKLNTGSTEKNWKSLEEVYKDHFIYRVYNQNLISTDKEYFKQSYMVTADNVIEFDGEPEKVRKEIKYIIVNSLINNQKGESMTTNADCPLVKKVNALIANQLTTFTEQDREWLMKQEEVILDKLTPKTPEPAKPIEVNSGQQIKDALKGITKPEEFLDLMPAEMRDQMRSGLALHQNRRNELISAIQTNAKDVWTEDSLKSMDMDMLERISRSTKAPVDYSANGGTPPQVNVGSEEVLMPLI